MHSQANHSWLLTLVEAMRAEWHCSLHQALFKESILATIDLWPALLSRHGVESRSMDPITKARQAAKEAMRTHIEAHYHVID
jgi:hypothetical protein